MNHFITPLLALLLTLTTALAQTAQERTQILVETNKGKFILELYNETPHHRDAFLRHVQAGDYDGVIFHRIIRDFMIQGGNLQTKGLKPSADLPEDSIVGTLPAEIMPERFIHERGALAAARQSDEVNPEMRSSASEFYIVTGKFFTDMDLKEQQEQSGVTYTQEQIDAYKFRGGAPHLDGAYTVFGRLIDGWKTVDKIQRVETKEADRPLKNVVIRRMTIHIPKKK